MAEDKIRITLPGGRESDAVRVHANSSEEHWNVYTLDDGTTLRMKTVVMEILRLEPVRDPEGKPVYFIRSQNVTDVRPSKQLP